MTRLKTIILTVVLLAVISFIAFVAFGLWFAKTQVEMYGVGGGVSLSTEPVEITIGDKGYLIPRNYIQAHNADGFKTGFNITVLLPNMEPITQENRDNFERGSVHNQYRVSLKNGIKAESAFKTKRHMNGPTLERGRKYGLQYFAPAVVDPKSSMIYDLFVLNDENGEFVEGIACDPEGRIGRLSNEPLNSICKDAFRTGGPFDYHITYSRKNLPDWLDNRVRFENLMDKFHQAYLEKQSKK